MITDTTSEVFWFFGATSVLSCALEIFSCAPKILAVRLEIYTWSHKVPKAKNKVWALCYQNLEPEFGKEFTAVIRMRSQVV